jgi:hypothetical protein
LPFRRGLDHPFLHRGSGFIAAQIVKPLISSKDIPGSSHTLILTQGELMRAIRTELSALLRRIAGELPNLPEGSPELRAAHANLKNIRRALARPEFRPPR